MFEVGKEYKTRDGRMVRIYATDAGGDYPIHGAILSPDTRNGWICESWDKDGKADTYQTSRNDIMPPRREVFGIFKKGNLFCTRNTLQEAEDFIKQYDYFEIVKFVEATDAN